LKLREQDDAAELIFYERADEAVERESNYQIAQVAYPEILKDVLARAFGILVCVEKSRRLLLWHEVRIHLDEVPGLGSFIELEAVAPTDSDLTVEYRHIAELREVLGIATERILAAGYSDELLRARA
jgi:adenylate cyclase, class 2